MSVKNAIAAAAKLLGNTPTICRKRYVHPVVLEFVPQRDHLIEDYELKADLAEEAHDFDENEGAVLNFLRHQAAENPV